MSHVDALGLDMMSSLSVCCKHVVMCHPRKVDGEREILHQTIAACRLGCLGGEVHREKTAQCHMGIALSLFVLISKRIFLYQMNILVLES